jgi:hypothetical protein
VVSVLDELSLAKLDELCMAKIHVFERSSFITISHRTAKML